MNDKRSSNGIVYRKKEREGLLVFGLQSQMSLIKRIIMVGGGVHQCDQMARSFFSIRLFTTIKVCPIA